MKTQTRAQEAASRIQKRIDADKGATPTEAKVAKTKTVAEPAPVLTPELINQLREAGSIDAGVAILSPRAAAKPKVDQTYELNTSCTEPLPQKRGVCIKVITAAVQLQRPFKSTDITAALPGVKSAGYWLRRLVKTSHLKEVAA
jgi:hypothetical protein